jgi:hypothetical protein
MILLVLLSRQVAETRRLGAQVVEFGDVLYQRNSAIEKRVVILEDGVKNRPKKDNIS